MINTTGTVNNGINGALGFNLNNVYNNNNNNNAGTKLGAGVIRSPVASTTGSSTALAYDLSRSPHILKKLSDLSALEKQMNWQPCALLSTQGLKGATTGGAKTGTGAGTSASTGAGAGAGTTSHQ